MSKKNLIVLFHVLCGYSSPAVVLGEGVKFEENLARLKGGNKQLLTFDYQFSLIVLDSAEMAQFRTV